MWSSQSWLRFKQSQSKPEKWFWGFNIRTHGLCIALRCSTNWAMKTHTLGSGQFIELIVPVKEMKHMNIMWTADKRMKYRCDHCSANAEAMGSNRVEAPKTFFGLTLRLLKSQLQLRWSHLHFIRMSAVHIIFIPRIWLVVNSPYLWLNWLFQVQTVRLRTLVIGQAKSDS